MNAPKALAAFIGDKDREQTVWTPPAILDAVDRVFPDGWGDVFPSAGSPATSRAAFGCLMNAYTDPWPDRCFSNPPYNDLHHALMEAWVQWRANRLESIQLVPIRTRRTWWCDYVDGAAVAYLKPLVFLDAKTGAPYRCINKTTGKATVSQFPENLAAVYWGARLGAFREAFAPLANHIQDRF